MIIGRCVIACSGKAARPTLVSSCGGIPDRQRIEGGCDALARGSRAAARLRGPPPRGGISAAARNRAGARSARRSRMKPIAAANFEIGLVGELVVVLFGSSSCRQKQPLRDIGGELLGIDGAVALTTRRRRRAIPPAARCRA